MILVRWETTPDDIHGMIAAQGILTAHGGMTSHAAVVARGMGKPCVAGCEGLSIDLEARTARSADTSSREGDVLTIDGGTGRVIVGPVRARPAADQRGLPDGARLGRRPPPPEGARERRHARRTPQGARVRRRRASASAARSTCSWRRPAARRPGDDHGRDEEGRRAALDRLLPMQQSDFEGIFEAMAGLPVTIRLLDPPLHEFLPAARGGEDEQLRARIRQLQEANPMLGTRGCRLGLQWPEIYEMQVRAIVRAARAVHERRAKRRSSRSCTRSSASRRSCGGCAS